MKDTELDELRRKIDRVDAEMLALLHQRLELTLRTSKHKTAIADPQREKVVLNEVRRHAKGLLRADFAAQLYAEIIAESKALQQQRPILAGFQGEHGAYSESAIRGFDKGWIPIPYGKFADVFEGVTNGDIDFGVVAVENSLEGAVTEVNDLLVETGLQIVAEIKIPIHHCLLTLPETDYRDIKVVYSHPQALAQCRGFIARNKLEPRAYYDTAGAAMMLAQDRPRAAAVIAGKLCAEAYDLEILKEHIEDHESNSTRFVVLARERGKEPGNKCSIVFTTAHKAGALFKVLRVFSDAGINLTRIESRPLRHTPGTFAFLLDCEGTDTAPRMAKALAEARKSTTTFKFLGCYQSV